MRNVLAHEYFGVDRGLVLDTVRNKVPELRRTLEAAPAREWDGAAGSQASRGDRGARTALFACTV